MTIRSDPRMPELRVRRQAVHLILERLPRPRKEHQGPLAEAVCTFTQLEFVESFVDSATVCRDLASSTRAVSAPRRPFLIHNC